MNKVVSMATHLYNYWMKTLFIQLSDVFGNNLSILSKTYLITFVIIERKQYLRD